jgi:hypothetical protein
VVLFAIGLLISPAAIDWQNAGGAMPEHSECSRDSIERHRSKANRRESRLRFCRTQSLARLAPIIPKFVPLAP